MELGRGPGCIAAETAPASDIPTARDGESCGIWASFLCIQVLPETNNTKLARARRKSVLLWTALDTSLHMHGGSLLSSAAAQLIFKITEAKVGRGLDLDPKCCACKLITITKEHPFRCLRLAGCCSCCSPSRYCCFTTPGRQAV